MKSFSFILLAIALANAAPLQPCVTWSKEANGSVVCADRTPLSTRGLGLSAFHSAKRAAISSSASIFARQDDDFEDSGDDSGFDGGEDDSSGFGDEDTGEDDSGFDDGSEDTGDDNSGFDDGSEDTGDDNSGFDDGQDDSSADADADNTSVDTGDDSTVDSGDTADDGSVDTADDDSADPADDSTGDATDGIDTTNDGTDSTAATDSSDDTADSTDTTTDSADATDPTNSTDATDATSTDSTDPTDSTDATPDATDSAADSTASATPSASADDAAASSAPDAAAAPPASATCAASATGPNAATISLIQQFEGFVPSPKPDPIGLATVGFGHKCVKANCAEVPFSFPLSQATAGQLLSNDAAKFVSCLHGFLGQNVVLNDNQFGALTAFAFNLGCGTVQSSTLLKRLNNGEDPNTVAAAEIPRFNKAGGKVLAGLTRRRAGEVALFQTPSSVVAHPLC